MLAGKGASADNITATARLVLAIFAGALLFRARAYCRAHQGWLASARAWSAWPTTVLDHDCEAAPRPGHHGVTRNGKPGAVCQARDHAAAFGEVVAVKPMSRIYEPRSLNYPVPARSVPYLFFVAGD